MENISNLTGNYSEKRFSQQDIIYEPTIGMIVLMTISHSSGMALISVSLAMFVKVKRLRTPANILEMNMLFSGLCFLLISMFKIHLTEPGCLLYSMCFIVFSTAETLITTGIAIQRYSMMISARYNSSMSSRPSSRKVVHKLACLWGVSLLLVAPLLLHRALGETDICIFSDGFFYQQIWFTVVILSVLVLLPILVTAFCYISIYQIVRSANHQRWMHQVQSYPHSRRLPFANVPLTFTRETHANQTSQRKLSKEYQILIKGLTAVMILILFWLPLSVWWLYMCMWGVTPYRMRVQLYILDHNALAVASNSMCYIAFSTKYNLHFKNILCAVVTGYKPTIQQHSVITPVHISFPEHSVISCPLSANYGHPMEDALEQLPSKPPSSFTSTEKKKAPMLKAMSFHAKPLARKPRSRNAVAPLNDNNLPAFTISVNSKVHINLRKSKSMESP